MGCSIKNIVESLRRRVPLSHNNYFVLPQDLPFVVELSAFPNLNIELRSLTKIDLFEFDPTLTTHGDNSNSIIRWALIRHHISDINSCNDRLFPNPMLVPLPSTLNFIYNKSPADNVLYKVIRDRIKSFIVNAIKEESLKSMSTSNFLNLNQSSTLCPSFDISIFERDDLFKILKTKYQGVFESSRRAQPNGPIPIIIDISWEENISNLIFSKYIPYQSEYNNMENTDPLASSWEIIPTKTGLDDECTLQHCLESFLTKETLSYNNSWYCPKCKINQLASKKFDIYKLPNILVIHLKRFSYNKIMRGKITKHIVFPINKLDMTPYVLNNSSKSKFYRLFAVSRHIGSLNGGHYTAYAKNHTNNKWYHFDDSCVSEIHDLNCLAQNAYILLYQLVDD